jgi:hypothetical protein
MSTPRRIITDIVRKIINDVGEAQAVRQSDDELLAYLNDGVREMVSILPDSFSKIEPFFCLAGPRQKLNPANSLRLISVLSVTNGGAITRMDKATLDLFRPNWRNTTNRGLPVHWDFIKDNPIEFEVYPPSEPGVSIDVHYVAVPPLYTIDQSMPEIPTTLLPALVDYIVYRSESKDDEHVLNARAKMAYADFREKLGVREVQDASD